MPQVDMDDIIEYQRFRKNPGPLLDRAADGHPLLLLKGRKRLVVLDMEAYTALIKQAGGTSVQDDQQGVAQ